MERHPEIIRGALILEHLRWMGQQYLTQILATVGSGSSGNMQFTVILHSNCNIVWPQILIFESDTSWVSAAACCSLHSSLNLVTHCIFPGEIAREVKGLGRNRQKMDIKALTKRILLPKLGKQFSCICMWVNIVKESSSALPRVP